MLFPYSTIITINKTNYLETSLISNLLTLRLSISSRLRFPPVVPLLKWSEQNGYRTYKISVFSNRLTLLKGSLSFHLVSVFCILSGEECDEILYEGFARKIMLYFIGLGSYYLMVYRAI